MTFDSDLFWQAIFSREFVDAAGITLSLAFLSQVVATVLGFFLALARTSGVKPLSAAASFYIWIWRAVPTLLWLLLIWNALLQLIPSLTEDWFTPFLAALVGLSLAEAAYMAEILRSSLLSVDPEQRLAAKALGLTPAQSMRKVVLAQMIRIAIPPTGSEFITVLKFTSLASVISLQELLTVAQRNISSTYRYAEFYAAAAVYYLVIVSVLMALQMRIERKYEWTTRRRATGEARAQREATP